MTDEPAPSLSPAAPPTTPAIASNPNPAGDRRASWGCGCALAALVLAPLAAYGLILHVSLSINMQYADMHVYSAVRRFIEYEKRWPENWKELQEHEAAFQRSEDAMRWTEPYIEVDYTATLRKVAATPPGQFNYIRSQSFWVGTSFNGDSIVEAAREVLAENKLAR